MDMYECSLRIRVAYVALNGRVKSPLGYVGASWSYGQHVAKNASAATAAGRPALQNWRRIDLDEALADARVLRNWGEAAVEQVDKYQSC